MCGIWGKLGMPFAHGTLAAKSLKLLICYVPRSSKTLFSKVDPKGANHSACQPQPQPPGGDGEAVVVEVAAAVAVVCPVPGAPTYLTSSMNTDGCSGSRSAHCHYRCNNWHRRGACAAVFEATLHSVAPPLTFIIGGEKEPV